MNKIYFCNNVKVAYLVKKGNYRLEPLKNNKVIVRKTNCVVEEPWYFYKKSFGLEEEYLNVEYPKLCMGDIAIERVDPIEIYLPNYSAKHKRKFITHNTLIHIKNFIDCSYYDQSEIDKRALEYLGLPLDNKVIKVDFESNNSDNSEKMGEVIPFSRKL